MSSAHENTKYLNKDNDKKIVLILFTISFFFGYLLSFFDIIFRPMKISFVNPFWFFNTQSQILLTALKGTTFFVFINLIFGALFIIPEFVMIILSALSFGSTLPFAFSSFDLLTFIISLLMIYSMLRIEVFSIKMGRKILALLKKEDYSIKLTELIIPSIILFVCQIILLIK